MASVGIIGGGLSGLVAAKTFLRGGFEVTVFEKEDEVGGVWARSRRYPGLQTQNARDTYAFSDFPMPSHYPEWPEGAQVQAYLASYADHFGVTPRVRLRTQVGEIRRRDGGGFVVDTRPVGAPASERNTHTFDQVIISSGLFSLPHIPAIPGREAFEANGGRVLHTTAFHDTSVVRGKRVVVVGFSKSACDVASVAVEPAREVTLVHRSTAWKAPRFLFGVVPTKYLLLNRFSEMFFLHPRAEGFERAMHEKAFGFVAWYWNQVMGALDMDLGLTKTGLRPEAPLSDVGCSLNMAPVGFYEAAQRGALKLHRGEIARFHEGAVETSDGKRIPADVVIFGTGFRQEFPFLEPSLQRIVQDEEGTFRLYRGLYHPDVPGLGFCGFINSLYSQLTSEVGARWLCELFRGRMKLPPREEVIARIDEHLAFRKRERPDAFTGGACIVPWNFHYIDDLCRDMGARVRRLPQNPFREFLLPVDPSLYADLEEELDARAREARDRDEACRTPETSRSSSNAFS
ncbi:flavin-containing monooxygenase [Polyangium jinanense]|uniref:NAD(P)-binding domain-containing protein n=1 Tax=Polyangium jinanense TaxID=2829994 RepID=A0A9X3XAF2_9BACT|nr:NAD(P)-binding domain-containing protein [Polyangium jinanense]MDC3983277.1 NAD(P)-binding domain-containing protein [Polyangium jinanense]MDC3985143.1 NAD(P)-binding domain-containing protein [Polyangium jinanense]